MRNICFLLLIVGLCSFTALAADSDALPANALKGAHVKFKHPNPHTFKVHGNLPTPHGFPAGVDTVTNFTGHFQAPGIYPASATTGFEHNIWEYSMVGNPPQKGGTTVFNAPIVPVSLDLRNADGSPRYVKVVSGAVVTCVNPSDGSAPAGCTRLFSDATPFVTPFVDGPVFKGLANYTSSSVPTQITDAVQKSEFGNLARPDWHTLLSAHVKTAEVMTLIRGTYSFSLNADGSCCLFVLIDEGAFDTAFFPQNPAGPDNNSVIGQAELNGSIGTKDISTFMFPNAYLFEGSLSNCCVLGFHTIDFEPGNAAGLPANGNLERFYVLNYSSWISPGLFADPTCSTTDPENCFQDVTASSHEIAETFNDPFVGFDGIHNITPFWQNPAGQCQDILEVGDVIEDLPNPTFPVNTNGFSYHPQTEALLPWFEFQKNSSALHNAYSYPNETALTALSAPQGLNCQ